MTSTPTPYDRARAFVRANGRILEQRIAGRLFDGDGPEAVAAAVAAYRNPDGGYGHALEPDTLSPDSQPLYAQVALESLDWGGATPDPATLTALCDHLAGVAGPGGGLPLYLPGYGVYPRASHWEGFDEPPPDINPTAAIVGMLHRFGANHPWVDDATAWCLTTLDADGLPADAHALRCVLALLEHLPDRARADAIADGVPAALKAAKWYREDPTSPEYGVTPLDLAPTPDSRWRALYSPDLIAGHLDNLVAEQQDDGGWPIRWEPPSEASVLSWRGKVTLGAAATLVADGRWTAG
jgi:hypothetical protein